MTFAKFSTDDVKGKIVGYVGEGEFTEDPLTTFGGVGVVKIKELQNLLQVLCKKGFEHRVTVNASRVERILSEAFCTYLG